jgi:secreted trypsin-like serine protease
MAGLYDYEAFQCAGTVIAPDAILTAAHCIGYFNVVQLGRYNIEDYSEVYEAYDIEKSVWHPGYYPNRRADEDPDDFAMIKIYGETKISPVRLN